MCSTQPTPSRPVPLAAPVDAEAFVVTAVAPASLGGTIDSLMTPSIACDTASFSASPTCSGTSLSAAIATPLIAIFARPFSSSCKTCAEITVPGCSASCGGATGETGAVDVAAETGAIVAAMTWISAESVACEAKPAPLTPR